MSKEDKDTKIFFAYDDYEILDTSRPEKNLLRAVLFSAMADLKKPGSEARKARDFFMSKDQDYLYSFQSICTHLDLDPKLVLMVTGLYERSEDKLPEKVVSSSLGKQNERRKEPNR